MFLNYVVSPSSPLWKVPPMFRGCIISSSTYPPKNLSVFWRGILRWSHIPPQKYPPIFEGVHLGRIWALYRPPSNAPPILGGYIYDTETHSPVSHFVTWCYSRLVNYVYLRFWVVCSGDHPFPFSFSETTVRVGKTLWGELGWSIDHLGENRDFRCDPLRFLGRPFWKLLKISWNFKITRF